MKITNQNPLVQFANSVQSKYNTNYLVDLLSISAIAKYLSPNHTLRDVDDYNEIVSQKYPELIYNGEIENQNISEINHLDVNPKQICDFLLNILINTRKNNYNGYFDIAPEYSLELAKMVQLPKNGNILSLNCSGISLFKEIIRQNKFEGNVHLYSENKESLKLAFLRIYPINQNVYLHLGHSQVENISSSFSDAFDFIYSMESFGFKKDNSIQTHITLAKNILKEKGTFFLFGESSLLITKKREKARKSILNHFDIDAVFNLSQAFKPYSGIDGSVLLLKNKNSKDNGVFVAHLNFLDESMEDIKYVIEKYYDYRLGKTVQSVSPLINQVKKEDLHEDFDVQRFNPKLQSMRELINNKYEIKKLNRICDIIKPKYKDTTKKYQKYPSDNSYKYVRTMDIKDGLIDTSSIKWICEKSPNAVMTRPGDILFSVKGTIGKIGVIDDNSANSLVSNSLIILRPHKNVVDTDYLYLALQSEYLTAQILSNITGTTIGYIAPKKVGSLEVPYINVSSQRKSIEQIKKLQKESRDLKKRLTQVELELKSKVSSLFD
ncbi:restriction endonuclease subunit S domain-containing protein [Methanohalophilus portucalensis]|uniref:Uncharacterized protein n=2 Tax=Methanohalophilus portucalensis TaxID=39664 RepID=A0A1L9C623_9EURY|nr:hypothetical protein [Methanohalophilus portucalensis]ATU08593.1 hypothetical protein BKM01_07295 [Methanohalophilus portucalensis]OJH49965.1 hypothetical protein MPF_0759 [Methanohalophilus portucalensis FDF-1]RNI13233.1 hypothetical protein EFE41_01210 [Methanohalophilus portucalensis FDF-1]SMH32494.1 hypothetical protein SAMN06264941_0591 [Methanohalophilus portucalensis FDF-1]